MGDELLAQRSGCSRNRSPRTATLYHSNGYAAELRIETDVTGVGYPCLKQLARAVHSKAEAGLKCRIYERKLYVTPQVLIFDSVQPTAGMQCEQNNEFVNVDEEVTR